VEDGPQRLADAIAARVRQEHHEELSKAKGLLQAAAVEGKIRRQIQAERKRLVSPKAHWISQ